MIVIGCVLAVAFASHASEEMSYVSFHRCLLVFISFGSISALVYSSRSAIASWLRFDELFSFFTTFRFCLYMVVMSLFIGIVYWAVREIETTESQPDGRSSLSYRRLHKFHRFGYGALSGAVGAQSVLFAKSASQLVHEGLFSMLLRYETYLVIGGTRVGVHMHAKGHHTDRVVDDVMLAQLCAPPSSSRSSGSIRACSGSMPYTWCPCSRPSGLCSP